MTPAAEARAAQAHALRQSGLRFHEIGRIMGVSTGQARLYVVMWERLERARAKLAENPDDLVALADTGQLSRRLVYALLNYGRLWGEEIRTVQDMATITDTEWSRIPLVGPAGIREAKAFLAKRAAQAAPDRA